MRRRDGVRFQDALRPEGHLYLTVELVAPKEARELNRQARGWGLPVVEGEVIWDGPDGYYHYYPPLPRVRAWIDEAGFAIDDELEGPWDVSYAYHHLLAHVALPSA